MKQIYGYAFHSPLVLVNLVPLKYAPVFLDSTWVVSDLKRNVDPALKKVGRKTVVLLAGSLRVLKMFVRAYPDTPVKVILFDFPGLIHPFLDPCLEWIDCDHQAGGAWQLTKTKLSNFEGLIDNLEVLGDEGKDFIERAERFVPKDKTNDIEKFAEYMPATYKELLEHTEEKQETQIKDVAWKKFTLAELLGLFLPQIQKHKRTQLLSLVLDYQLGKVNKRDYSNKIKFFVDNNANAKKLSTATRKWMDDGKHGRILFKAYLDYLCNLTRRSWKTILEDHGAVAELDLLILIAQQCRDNVDLSMHYVEECKGTLELPANMNPPEATVKWSDGTLHYHPESPALLLMFELA